MNYVDSINKYRIESVYSLSRYWNKKIHKNISCWAPFQAMHINKKGRIKPCPFSMQSNYVKKQIQWSPEKSLKECWNDMIYEEMRNESISGSLHNALCEYCIKQCMQNKPPSSLDYDFVGGKKKLDHQYPKEIELELSNTCNYMCDACSPWCSSQWAEKLGLSEDPRFKSSFDDPLFKEAFIEDLRSIIHHVHRINFTGGEPFAQRIVYDILKMIEDEDPKNLNIHFTTNGSVMNGAVKRVIKRKKTRFTVSLDSINPKTYPTIRVNGKLENVMNNIQYMLNNCNQRIGASFVLSKKNIKELPEILSWCNEKGIIFSYHILENMGYRDWEKEIKPICIEAEEKEYLTSLKNWLLENRSSIRSPRLLSEYWLYKTNMKMYDQYIERLK